MLESVEGRRLSSKLYHVMSASMTRILLSRVGTACILDRTRGVSMTWID